MYIYTYIYVCIYHKPQTHLSLVLVQAAEAAETGDDAHAQEAKCVVADLLTYISNLHASPTLIDGLCHF